MYTITWIEIVKKRMKEKQNWNGSIEEEWKR